MLHVWACYYEHSRARCVPMMSWPKFLPTFPRLKQKAQSSRGGCVVWIRSRWTISKFHFTITVCCSFPVVAWTFGNGEDSSLLLFHGRGALARCASQTLTFRPTRYEPGCNNWRQFHRSWSESSAWKHVHARRLREPPEWTFNPDERTIGLWPWPSCHSAIQVGGLPS